MLDNDVQKIKILEYMDEFQLKPTGGPVGYLHGLYTEDKKNGCRLEFIKQETNLKDNKNPVNKKNIWRKLFEKIWYVKVLTLGRHCEYVESNKYDIIHFHTTFDLYNCRKSIKKSKSITVLTSHSPTLAMRELYENWDSWEKILFYPLYMLMKKIDYEAFNIADYVVFPCEEATEPYTHAWKKFPDFKSENEEKFRYLLSGTFKREPKRSCKEIRGMLNIPDDAFVICYVGRHNQIKGYDKLKEIAEELLKEESNVYFLIAGTEGPLKRIEHPRWIEIGWTNDPHSYICASDLFILPNKETYFDLVLLEVLSLGKIILASNTGGNRYFNRERCDGVVLFNDVDSAINNIHEIMSLGNVELQRLENENRKMFDNVFDNPVFYQNYIQLLNNIYEDNQRKKGLVEN